MYYITSVSSIARTVFGVYSKANGYNNENQLKKNFKTKSLNKKKTVYKTVTASFPSELHMFCITLFHSWHSLY